MEETTAHVAQYSENITYSIYAYPATTGLKRQLHVQQTARRPRWKGLRQTAARRYMYLLGNANAFRERAAGNEKCHCGSPLRR